VQVEVDVSATPADNSFMAPALDNLIIGDYPQLQLISWNRHADDTITGEEAFGLYEANWRFVDVDKLEPHEREMITRLAQAYGRGLMNV
jgi:hypothetical protein